MKKLTLLYITALFGLAGCSNIAEDERLVFVAPTLSDRAVLIEDFTGQKCPRCPLGTEAIHQMQEAYGEDKVIAVAIHSGVFGVSKATKKYSIALKTDFTQQYWDKFFEATQGQPVAKINRGEKSEDYGNWSSLVKSELAIAALVNIQLNCVYSADTRTLKLNSTLSSTSVTGAKYQLWIVEDSIVTGQSMPDNTVNAEYVHNHVLRAAINGTWGEDFNISNGRVELNHTYSVPSDYVAENCSVVAFVYTEAGVLQAAKVKLTK